MAKEKILIILGVILVVFNLVVLDIFYLKRERKLPVSPPSVSEPLVTPRETVYREGCGEECRKRIAEEVGRAMATISGTKEIKEKEVTREVAVQPSPQPQTVYLPLGGGGSTVNRDWTDIEGSEFVFDLADYPANSQAYWQGNLKVRDPNSRCYARIYDSTHSRGVDFSEQSTPQTSFETLTSSPLAIWRGENHYQMQVKSLDGSPCYLESPKLIVKT